MEIETIKTDDGWRATIFYDDDPMSPREWDNVFSLVLYRRGWDLPREEQGGKELLSKASLRLLLDGESLFDEASGEYLQGMAAMQALLVERFGPSLLMFPVYCYEHGGIALSTSDFGDRWDSGCIGIAYCTEQRATDELSASLKLTGDALRKRALECAAQEVETFGQYLNGEVYGYSVRNPKGTVTDSCVGLMPCDYAEEEARASLARCREEARAAFVEETSAPAWWEVVG